MTGFTRYAVYMVPEGEFYRAGAAWLGWDSVGGCPCPHPALADLPHPVQTLTATPRKYGLHATIKPPFRLAHGTTAAALAQATQSLCRGLAPVTLPGLAIRRLGGFVAAVPAAPSDALQTLAATVVAELDRFRAPPSASELARRRAAPLSPRHEALLQQWGYPYVMEAFRFHITLSGSLPAHDADRLCAILGTHFAPVLPQPCVIDSLCLMGEDDAGAFHLIHRYALSG